MQINFKKAIEDLLSNTFENETLIFGGIYDVLIY